MANDKNSHDNLTSAVFDNGRRGQPRPGCDCEQCFGYCLIDDDKAARESSVMGARNPSVGGSVQPLDFNE